MTKIVTRFRCYSIFFSLLIFAVNSAFGQVPAISSFSPQSGPLGTKVVITGTNFSATAAQNIVYFGPVRAIISAATATSITVYVPVGASFNPISVTVNTLTASSATPFVVTKIINQNISSTSFAPHADFAMLASPEHFALGDYDYNGIIDISLATTATGFNNFSVFRSTADCKNLSFGAEQLFYSGSAQQKGGMATADLDNDGQLDVAIAETSANIVTVHQSLSYPGAVGFQNQSPLSATTLPQTDLKTADMDGDGKSDIVVGLFNGLAPTGGVAIYRNTSSGIGILSFAAPQVISFLANTKNIELADVDGDGKSDLIISDGAASVHIRRNISTTGTLDNTSFGAEAIFATAANPQDLRAGDIDGDGKPDLTVACGSSISILRNTATAGTISAGSFALAVNFSGVTPTSIDLGDINGDGKIDVAIGNGTNVSVFQNQATSGTISSGSLGSKLDFSIGSVSVNQVRLADMNGDGYLDIAAAQTGNFFSVFLFNPPPAPVPTITSFSPASGVANSSVTIIGTNFGVSAPTNRVYFGATRATVTSASATQLVVSVPLYATYGPITVENLSENLSVSSRTSFNPLFNNNKDFGGRIIPASLAPKVDLAVGTVNATSVNLGDIDGDGFPDILVSTSGNDSLIIFRNKGNNILGPAGFEKTRLYFLTDGNGTVLASDIDNDGKLDVVMMVRGPGDQDELLIYHNESAPGSLSPASFGPAFQVHLPFLHINNTEFVVSDMDGDGKADLVCENSGAISVFKNNSSTGSFCFAPSVDLVGAGGQAISVGDIDGDGKPDLAVAGGYYGTQGFKLIRNTSTVGLLSFSAPVTFSNGQLVDVEIGDMDSDGKPDVLWVGANAFGNALHVMKNTATAGTIDASSLAPEVDYLLSSPVSGSPYSHTRIADINGDGKPDVVTCQYYLGVFENASKPGIIDASSFHLGVPFNPAHDHSTDYAVQFPAVGDLDGDGKPEIIATESSYVGNIIAIYRNESYPAPRIDLLKNSTTTTQSGPVGSPIITQGDFQFTNNQQPLVRFGSTLSAVSTVTNTAINTAVPPGAITARISVTSHGLTGFSPLPFNPTFVTNGTLDATTFATKVDFPLVTGGTPALSVSDLDNDGKPDIAAGDGGYIAILRNTLTTAGTDIAATTFTSILPDVGQGIGLDPIVITDIDGDGFMDLTGGGVMLRNNSGTQGQPITFETNVSALVGANPNGGRPIANIDFNHDGKNDHLVAGPNTVFVNENLSIKGSFYAYAPLSTYGYAVSFTSTGNLGETGTGDFDGDGFDDIVFVNSTTAQLISMRNAGLNAEITTASFGAQQPLATGVSPYYVYVSDFNLDGKLDVAVGYTAIATVSVYQNTSSVGSISFSKLDFTSLPNIFSLNAADLDGDGKPELVTIHGNGSSGFNFSILKNTSTSTIAFASKIDYSMPNQPQGLALADVNLDGKTDILISHSNVISVFQNNLQSSHAIVILPQPLVANVCGGAVAQFSVGASGTTNITYHWQYSTAPAGTYTDLMEGNGYSNVATANLSVNTSGNFGAGYYRVRVNGDLATEVISANAQLIVSPAPAAPTASDASTCNGGTATLTASGGTDGKYKWYTTPTGADNISGAVNSSFTTPELTTSSTFYVSVTSTAGCESTRTPVKVTVLPTACSGAAPVIETEVLSTVPGGIVVVNLVPLITAEGSLDPTSIKVITPPASGAVATITNGVLTIDYKNIPFKGIESITIEACDVTGVCTQQDFSIHVSDDLIVYNGLSPNTDNKNDFFNILNIEVLPTTQNNKVTIYNRWGDEVYSVEGYNNSTNVFTGVSSSGNKLPAGVYFYKIDLPDAKKTLTGFLSLKF